MSRLLAAACLLAFAAGCSNQPATSSLPDATSGITGTTASMFSSRTDGLRSVNVTTVSASDVAPAATAAFKANVVSGCALFPSGDYGNRNIATAEVDPNSAAMIEAARTHGISGGMSGVNESEMLAIVSSGQTTANMTTNTEHKISVNPWPIGGNFSGPYQTSGDGYLIVLKTAPAGSPCTLYISGYTKHNGDDTWVSYGGGSWNLGNAETSYPLNCNSSTCGGTGISTTGIPGRLFNPRTEEFAAGSIDHTVDGEFPSSSVCGHQYVSPAIQSATGGGAGLSSPCLPGGAKIRLKASFSESGYSRDALTWIHQLKSYGIAVLDNGCCWGTYWNKPRGSDADFNQHDVSAVNARVRITDFEVIKF